MQSLDTIWLNQIESRMGRIMRHLAWWYNYQVKKAALCIFNERIERLDKVVDAWNTFLRLHEECTLSLCLHICHFVRDEFGRYWPPYALFLPSDTCWILWGGWDKNICNHFELPCFSVAVDSLLGYSAVNVVQTYSQIPTEATSCSLGDFCVDVKRVNCRRMESLDFGERW